MAQKNANANDIIWKYIGVISSDHQIAVKQISFHGRQNQLMLSTFWNAESRVIICNMKQNPCRVE